MKQRVLWSLFMFLTLYGLNAQSPGGINVATLGAISQEYYPNETWSGAPTITTINSGTFPKYPKSSSPCTGETFIWTARLCVPEKDVYDFKFKNTDDGAELVIDGAVIIPLSSGNANNSVTLSAGCHTLRVRYKDIQLTVTPPNPCGNQHEFNLQWSSSSFGWQDLPAIGASTNYLSLWLQGKSATPLGGSVSQWNDASPMGNNLTACATSAQPASVNNINDTLFNFNPYLRFNDATMPDDYLGKTGFSMASSAASIDAFNYFVVYRYNKAGRTDALISYANWSGTDDNEFMVDVPDTLQVNIDNQTNITNVLNFPNKLTLLTVQHSGYDGELKVGQNGASSYQTTNFKTGYTLGNSGKLLIGQEQDATGFSSCGGFLSFGDTASQSFRGQMAEVILLSREVSNQERERVESYLGIKYGLTLAHNYYASNDSLIYNIAAPFNNRVFGIGRDNASGLAQVKSRSVLPNSYVTIESPSVNVAANDLRFVMLGDNDAGVDAANVALLQSSINNSRGLSVTKRIWKVANYHNSFTDSVTVSVNVANMLNSFDSTQNYFLIVSKEDSANFQELAGIHSVASRSGSVLTFKVPFRDNQYFRIGRTAALAPEVAFVNRDTGAAAPSNTLIWEACANSLAAFQYQSFKRHPDAMIMAKKGGGSIRIPMSQTGIQHIINLTDSVPQTGSIYFQIPDSAATGTIQFMYGSDTIYYTNSFLVINNSNVDLIVGQNAPYCADDTVSLLGAPEGGRFNVTPALYNNPNVIRTGNTLGNTQTGTFLGSGLFSTNINQDSVRVAIDYTYTPHYISDTSAKCPTKVARDTVTVFDNRLSSVVFNPILALNSPFNPTEQVMLDTLLDSINTIPTINSATINNTIAFNGNNTSRIGTVTYLNYGASPGVFSYTITMSYNNNGCKAARDGRVTIIPPIRPRGLDSIYCNGSPSIAFGRDPLFRDTIQMDTVERYAGGVPATIINRHSYMNVTHPYIAAYPAAITVNSTVTNNEQYTLNPNVLPVNTTQTIIFTYQTNETVYTYKPDGSLDRTLPLTPVTYTARYKVQILPRDIAAIDTSQIRDNSNHCSYAQPIVLHSSPYFRRDTTNRYYTTYVLTERSQSRLDSLTQDSVINFGNLYQNQAAALGPNRDVPLRMVYTVYKYGCIDRDTINFTIRADIPNMFVGGVHTLDTVTIGGVTNNNVYCLNEPNDRIQTTPARGTGSSTRRDSILTTHNGSMVVNTAPISYFNPIDTGRYYVEYIYWDIYNCRNYVKDTFFVRKPLPTVLQTSDNRSGYCATDTVRRILRIAPSQHIKANTRPTFTGFGVVQDSFFRPSTGLLSGTSGSIYAVLTDTVGCPVYDTLTISLTPVPVLTFQGDTSFAIPVDSAFCRSENLTRLYPSINSTFAPFNGAGTFTSVRLRGVGVVEDSVARTYYYNPAIVPANRIYDTLTFTVLDGNTCSALRTQIIRLDSVPRVSFANLSANYCRNDSALVIRGIPDTLIAGGRGTITSTSTGLNVNTGRFSPLASQLGVQYMTYRYIDSRGCSDDTTQMFQVLSPPNSTYTGLNVQYCQTDARVMVTGVRVATGIERGRFWVDTNARAISMPGTRRDTGYFLPDTIGVGAHTLYYAFTDVMGCKDTSHQNFFIHPIPAVDIVMLDSVYCQTSPIANVIGTPVGGVLTDSTNGRQLNGMSIIAAGVATFNPALADTGVHRLRYTYIDPVTSCRNRDSVDVRVFPSMLPTITGLPSATCETRDTIYLSGIPTGGHFAGVGILPNTNNKFLPAYAGRGTHVIRYTVSNTFPVPNSSRQITCENTNTAQVTVNPLPIPVLDSPALNSRYCVTDTTLYRMRGHLLSTTDSITSDTVFRGRGVVPNVFLVLNPNLTYFYDTTYYFKPSAAGYGQHSIKMKVANRYGCVDSTAVTYYVDSIGPIVFSTPMDSAYCSNEPTVPMTGSPLGGYFTRDGRVLPSGNFVPGDPAYWTNGNPQLTHMDTLQYVFNPSGGVCTGVATHIVRIDPTPSISFTGASAANNNVYCVSNSLDTLIPNLAGGVFTGRGIVFGTALFSSVQAGVGIHPITYTYRDTHTLCVNSWADTFRVYSHPKVGFVAVGGCGDSDLKFNPDNLLLGLNGNFNGRLFDSITLVRWNFGDGNTLTPPIPSASRTQTQDAVDSIRHQYTTPGTYNAVLTITNHNYCTDSARVRVVVVPKIVSYPYLETFDNGSGGWLDENRDSRQNTWQLGTPNNSSGIDVSTTSNNSQVWITTVNNGYPDRSDAVVYSPCFDLTALDRPMIAMDYWSHTPQGVDGTVVEYMDEFGRWKPLGVKGRGIEWFNSDAIAGSPGDVAPIPFGWSGLMDTFANGRYKLDSIRFQMDSSVYKNFRFRIAFGSSNLASTQYDGFAFDNVWIGNRTRNVLVEHFANIGTASMDYINNHVYNVCYSPQTVRDAILIQTNMNVPITDEFYAGDASNSRTGLYGIQVPAYLAIDGRGDVNNRIISSQLTSFDLEKDMLMTPKFLIDPVQIQVSGTQVRVKTIIRAPKDVTDSLPYFAFASITEDSLEYVALPNTFVQSVLRTMLPDPAGTPLPRMWAAGDSIIVDQTWNYTPGVHRPQNFEAIVFVQTATEGLTTTVHQAVSTRDLRLYTGTTVTPAVEAQADEASSALLFPNPTENYFNVAFEKPLSRNYNWKLVDLHGRVMRAGLLYTGQQQMTVSELDLASGMYFFVISTNDFAVQRKVVITRP